MNVGKIFGRLTKKQQAWLGVAVLVLVLVALLAYAFRPTAAVERASRELAEVERSQFTAELVLENNEATKQLLGEQGAIEVDLRGAFDRSGERSALQSDITITMRSESVTVELEGEVRLIDDKAYLFIRRSPQLFPALAGLKDQWIAIDRGASDQPETELTGTIFTRVDRVGTEDIGDRAAVRYETVATAEAVVRVMDAVAEVLGTNLSEEQIGEIRESVAQIEEVPVTLWVKRFSSDLVQLATELTVPGGNTVRFTLGIQEPGKAVVIEVPAGAVPLQQAVEQAVRAATP